MKRWNARKKGFDRAKRRGTEEHVHQFCSMHNHISTARSICIQQWQTASCRSFSDPALVLCRRIQRQLQRLGHAQPHHV